MYRSGKSKRGGGISKSPQQPTRMESHENKQQATHSIRRGDPGRHRPDSPARGHVGLRLAPCVRLAPEDGLENHISSQGLMLRVFYHILIGSSLSSRMGSIIEDDFPGEDSVEKFIENQSVNCPVSKISYSPVKLYLRRSVVRNQKAESEAFFYEEISYDLVEVVREHNKVVLVGDAGIGKTSELGRIANYFSDDQTTYYPFFVSLNTYIDQKIEDLFNSDWNQIPSNLLLFFWVFWVFCAFPYGQNLSLLNFYA